MGRATEKTSLSAILRNRNSEEVGSLDRFLIAELFDTLDKRLFSKGGLYRAIQGTVPRPQYYDVELPPHEQRLEDIVAPTVKKLRQMLDSHGEVYLKNVTSTVGGGHGLIKMTVDDEKVRLRIPRSGTRDGVEGALNRLFSEGSEDFVQFSQHTYPEPDIVDIPIMHRRANQPLGKILYVLIKHGFEPGEYVIEAPIQIPSYNERTWEVRNIVQCPNGVPQISARYAKVGTGKDFSNITLGGEAESPEMVVAGVYQTHTKTDLRTAKKLAEEYIKSNDSVALISANALNKYMLELASRFLNGVNPRVFYAREFSVDITGQFDSTQRLRPIVGELQYPLGFMSYIPGLSKTDPEGLNAIYEVGRIMREQDVVLLRQ